jgi:DNA topoisomerase I
MEGFWSALPKLRRTLARELQSDELTERRVTACTVRLLDIGMLRVGNPEYAADESGVGLATIHKEHVSLKGESIAFDYPAKGGVRRLQVLEDPGSVPIVRRLKRRRGGPPELFAYRENGRWRPIRSDDINDFIKDEVGEEFSAKDFRTWNATVMAGVTLAARGGEARSKTGSPPGDQRNDGASRRVARQHSRGCTPLLHRPARIRPIPGRPHRGAGGPADGKARGGG